MKDLYLDIETTSLVAKGLRSETDYLLFPRIVSIAWDFDGQEHHYLIKQTAPIPKEATEIHGITDKMCEEKGQDIGVILVLLLTYAMASARIIGFNIYFDTSIIKSEFLRLVADGVLTEAQRIAFWEAIDATKRVDVCQKAI